MDAGYTPPSPAKRAEWARKAAKKKAIVPEYFVVYPEKAEIVCGACRQQFVRPLVLNRNEPVFVCPNEACKARNWLPVYFDLNHPPGKRR